MYVFVGLHCLLPKAVIRVEVSCKKSVLKYLVNLIEKKLCWSLFFIKLQAWHLFWKTSTNEYLYHSLLLSRFTLYSAPSTSLSLLLLIISPMFVFGSNLKGFKVFKSGISFSLKSLTSLYVLFPYFFCFSQSCFVFFCCCS